ncbi:MAG: alpha/beta hydrolase [Erysipelotrichaceae bacterium]
MERKVRKVLIMLITMIGVLLILTACSNKQFNEQTQPELADFTTVEEQNEAYTLDTKIQDVINDPIFGQYGRLLFPLNDNYYSGETLKELRLVWYSHIDPDKTVEILNYLRNQLEAGQIVFYDIYTETEKLADPSKNDTGLVFFRGQEFERFAICNAGGGFAYVGAIHDSFPHALELSKLGYNAFALIYRPDAVDSCEDLARAIEFAFEHSQQLQINPDGYSLWGGSAGGRMVACLSSYGTESFTGVSYPKPAASIIQYTGYSDYTPNDSPTYMCVGENDSIVNWQVMEKRSQALASLAVETEFIKFAGLGHGFGLGTNTTAEGWLYQAVSFWQAQMD